LFFCFSLYLMSL